VFDRQGPVMRHPCKEVLFQASLWNRQPEKSPVIASGSLLYRNVSRLLQANLNALLRAWLGDVPLRRAVVGDIFNINRAKRALACAFFHSVSGEANYTGNDEEGPPVLP